MLCENAQRCGALAVVYCHLVQYPLSSSLSKNVKIRICKNIIVLAVLYWCETWFLTLMKKERLMVFKNRVLKRIVGPKREKVIGGWRTFHNEELQNLYCLPIIIGTIK
jgi:hypothetical protein